MKPIEKYEQKFIQLLKEMEEEFGANLCVNIQSHKVDDGSGGLSQTQYNFEVSTSHRWLII